MNNTNWPDEIRLKMIEKSEFYQPNENIYQYGYYDGYQQAQEENERLRESLEKIMNMKAVQDNVGLSQYFIKSRAIASNALLTPTPQP